MQAQDEVIVSSEAFDLEEEFSSLPEEARRGFADGLAVTEVGLMIRQLREAASLKQGELAKALGTTQSSISELERGVGPQGPTFAMLKRIVEACSHEMAITMRPKVKKKSTPPSPIQVKIVKA
jgi:DNA-binding XRE family transcriptional regulator